jgi:uncharacterized protein (TIGR00290 family)
VLTTVDEETGSVPHHHVPRDLLRALGMPLVEVAIPRAASNVTYEQRMREAFAAPPLGAVREVAFGDLFLADLRAYRESRMADAGLRATFPLWGRDTAELARSVVREGFEAVVVSVDPSRGDRAWLGRRYDEAFLDDLPDGVDPCGENGEFHTFVFDGPTMLHPVKWSAAGIRERDGFPYFALR